MDYFGQIADELESLWSEIHASPDGDRAAPLLRMLDRAMAICATLERERSEAQGDLCSADLAPSRRAIARSHDMGREREAHA